MQTDLTALSDSVSGGVEFLAANKLQERMGVEVHQHVQLNGAESALSQLLGGVSAAGRASALSALVERLQGLPGLRAVVLHFTARACADLEDLRADAAGGAAAATAAPADAEAAALDADIQQAHLAALRALQNKLAAAAGSAMDPGSAAAALAALDGAQRYIDGTRRHRCGSNSNSMSSRCSSPAGGGSRGSGTEQADDSADSSDNDADVGGAQTCTLPFDAAMMLLDAARRQDGAEQRRRLARLLRDGPASMLVLSALQPAASTSSGGSGGGFGAAGFMPPVTQLELDGLAVQREGAKLRVVMLAAEPNQSGLPAAREQLRRAGTILAYVYNVAAAAGVYRPGEGEPPRLRLEGRIALARLRGLSLPQREREVELVPAEGQRHMMRERVTGLSGSALHA
ncbi:hypothetical protein HXX76_002835 [Chlamydomonas incerta]|uniref:Uncharacterized protein n=1 Tax=Chlamydomonas incerta TaxID=51695 RepID=A0A835W999_CHLIN|nr:hypothetical protein HXX76_002835 [Chlamydomonas incerta]|eukprot:KAG2442754.1 hypothetical protein HXX76_002835 [Chlamydomonas incerta]